MKNSVLTIAFCCLLVSPAVVATDYPSCDKNGYCPLDNRLIALNTTQGYKMLADGKPHSFFQLIQNLVSQETTITCGLATVVTIANSMHLEKPPTRCNKQGYCYRLFTENYFSETLECSKKIVNQFPGVDGLELFQVRDIFQKCLGLNTSMYFGNETSYEEAKQIFASSYKPGRFVVANYGRSALYQDCCGHFSPIAAYNVEQDRVLVLDVMRFKYPPVWVRTRDMFNAINSTSSLANSRGLLVVEGPTYESKPTVDTRCSGGHALLAHNYFKMMVLALIAKIVY